jgi:hypothetical protein
MAASMRGREPGGRVTSAGEYTADSEDLVSVAVKCTVCELAIVI